MKIRHLHHSCMLIEVSGLRILVDPGSFSPDAASQRDLDAVVLTHQHPDHVDPEALATILEGNPVARVIAEPETAERIAGIARDAPGDREVVALAAGGSELLDAGDAGQVRISAHGGRHAVIHPDIPQIGNVGYVIEPVRADEAETGRTVGPRLGITGDSLEPIDAFRGIDALAFAVVAPWSKMRETIDFLREVKPVLALPVHDAVASAEGRAIYLRQSIEHAPEGTEVRDWPESRAVTI